MRRPIWAQHTHSAAPFHAWGDRASPSASRAWAQVAKPVQRRRSPSCPSPSPRARPPARAAGPAPPATWQAGTLPLAANATPSRRIKLMDRSIRRARRWGACTDDELTHLYAPADDVGEARQRPDRRRRRGEARVGHLPQRGEVVQPRARPRHQVPLAPRPRAVVRFAPREELQHHDAEAVDVALGRPRRGATSASRFRRLVAQRDAAVIRQLNWSRADKHTLALHTWCNSRNSEVPNCSSDQNMLPEARTEQGRIRRPTPWARRRPGRAQAWNAGAPPASRRPHEDTLQSTPGTDTDSSAKTLAWIHSRIQ